MKHFLTALSFLTTIPLSAQGQVAEEDLAQSLAFFPFVGLIIGTLSALTYTVGRHYWGPSVAAGLWLTTSVLVSGGLHLDGWIDTFDGLGSRKSRSEKLLIMRDSRIGAMGAISLVLLLGLKWTLLAQYQGGFWWLVLIPAVSRGTMVLAIQLFDYARKEGLGAAYSHRLSPAGWVLAASTILVPIVLTGAVMNTLSLILTLALSMVFARALAKELGGLTGDTYGAINELAELLIILFFFTEGLV